MNNPVHESQLPAVLLIEDIGRLLGMPVRTVYDEMKKRSWPFTELPRMGRKRRWSRDHVLAVINGGAVRRSRVA